MNSKQSRTKKGLRTFRRLNLSMRMSGLSARPHVWSFGQISSFDYCLRKRTIYVPARLHIRAGSPEHLLFTYVVTAVIPRRGLITFKCPRVVYYFKMASCVPPCSNDKINSEKVDPLQFKWVPTTCIFLLYKEKQKIILQKHYLIRSSLNPLLMFL